MKKNKKEGRKAEVKEASAPSGGLRIVAGIVIVAVAELGGWAWGRYSHSDPPTMPTAPTMPTVSPTEPVATAPVKTPPANTEKNAEKIDFQKLKGRWQRTDGGYILDIQAVNPDGTLEAVYLNPRPIHVAKAAAARDGAALLVLVELRDKNYPGSTYRLTYDADGDQLSGDYFQAVAKEHFDVAFKRMK